ncbi:unnamed protein product [Anisakis simplex]|uniref:Potassium channel domain-containing protein n=1 Tax=Anisakis simplex TaxID=6269 RepID=A0A3P6NPX6_ANISI|nr:unnamed protein product [Anisakis simplex]
MAFLLVYLFLAAWIIWLFSPLTYLNAVYFSITSIFTIGFGDIPSPIPIPYLILFIIVGVILVTITVELVAAEAINHIHYMGRHVGTAKRIANKMIQLAQSINMNRGIMLGRSQLESLSRFNLATIGIIDKKFANLNRPQSTDRLRNTAFHPLIVNDLEFMDLDMAHSEYGSPKNFVLS